jgi:hypothetical protein
MPAPAISVELDVKAIRRMQKRAERFRGLPLGQRMQKGTLEAMRLLVAPVKRETPVSNDKDPGGLRNKVKARQSRARDVFGNMTKQKTYGAELTSTARHRHLVIRGHRIVTPGGRDTGRRSTANPFIDRAAEPRKEEAMRIVSRAIFGGA